MKPAKCKCGHVGKSNRPEFYQCGACYYENRAASNLDKAKKLEHRAARLRAESKIFKAKVVAFKRHHPEAGHRDS